MSLINHKLDNKNLHHFTHNAMATIFEIVIELDDKEYAEQAATAAFDEIDRLEDELSRFRPNSDVARINNLSIDEELKLSSDIFECLRSANDIYNITDGLFDVSAGQIIDLWKTQIHNNLNTDESIPNDIGMNKIVLDETNHSISVLNEDLIIDLGGFGKGYAIDVACELLTEWEIENALLHSGGSTVKAIGKLDGYKGWPITISNPSNPSQIIVEIILKDFSLSGSGEQKRTHIINPKTGMPINERPGAWAMCESAAQSDAMSTTFMIMPIDDIIEFCNVHDFISGMGIKNNVPQVRADDVFLSDNFLNCKNYLLISDILT